MKAKLFFTIILLTSLVQNSFSQAYIPLLNNSSWYIQQSTQMGPRYLWIEPGVDVVIGLFTYKKFLDINYSHTEIYIREDVATKKVYRRLNNADVLLFDFSLQVGNTITLGNGNLYSVYSISTVNVNGGQRRVFNLENLTNPNASWEKWIEGVGNWEHPLKPNFEFLSEDVFNITCSYQNGESVFNFGLANGGTATTCPSPTLSIENQNVTVQKFKVFPNPFSAETIITTETNLENGSLEVYNSIGQKVKVMENINTNEIILNKGNLLDGLYFLTLKQNGKIVETKKIIIQG